MIGDVLPPETERIAAVVVDAVYKVHTTLGPGLLESVYEECLAFELTKRGLKVERQVLVPLYYDGVRLSIDLRLDLLVEDQIIIELKAVEKTLPVHAAQLRSHMQLSNKRLGFLTNFNVVVIKDGIKRIIL